MWNKKSSKSAVVSKITLKHVSWAILGLVMAMGVSHPASADEEEDPTEPYSNVEATVYASLPRVSPLSAQAAACNYTYNRVIYCRTQTMGIFANGTFLTSWTNMVLPPGACSYSYVYSDFYPFASSTATAICSFGRAPSKKHKHKHAKEHPVVIAPEPQPEAQDDELPAWLQAP